jgi:hypothetical protein
MNQDAKVNPSQARYELRFIRLLGGGCQYAFPCDSEGRVSFADLSERTRCNYLFARTVVGREFSAPLVSLVE